MRCLEHLKSLLTTGVTCKFRKKVTMSSIAVARTTIELGSLEIEVFQSQEEEIKEDEYTYYLSITQVLGAIGANDTWFRTVQKRSPGVFKWLQDNGFRGVHYEGKILSETKARKAKLISVPDASLVWLHFALNGNELAQGLLVACTIEAIERRADKAFGRIVTEQERNEKLKSRIAGIQTRKTLTKSIQDWYARNPNGTTRPMHAMISTVTNLVYQRLWGMDAKQLEDHLGCARHEARNYLDPISLRNLERAEDNLIEFICEDNLKPVDAVPLVNIRTKPLPTRTEPIED